jgi:hypothetical protein
MVFLELAVLTPLNALESAAIILLLLHAANTLGDLLGLLACLRSVLTLTLQGFLDFLANFLAIEAFTFEALDILLAHAGALEFLADLLLLASLVLLGLAVLLLLSPLLLAEAALRPFVQTSAFLHLHLADAL